MECASCGSVLTAGARFCAACGTPVESAPSADERKVATVLFADLVGSTSLGASQDPERTRAMLDRFYDAMAAEITRSGGTVEKFVGDAVMAVFGAPAAQEDHAERALHASLSMRRRLEELFDDALQLRIGVNTGEVVVGAAREGSSFVTGDAVNVSARLEQNAEPGEILVGERTVSLVRGAFEFGPPLRVEAKGKDDGVESRRLVRALTLMRPRGVGGLRSVFVGRQTELELLETTYRRVVEAGEPHVVTIMGDAGIGKSRLVRELWDRLGGHPEAPLRRTGRCLPYGQGITYWPLGEILKEHLGILESDSPESIRARLAGRDVLGLTLGLDLAEKLHPLTARQRLQDGWAEFLGELASERPTVVLVEDLHWAEEPLLDLLERVIREVHDPLMLVGTARAELLDRRPAWGGGRRNASLLWLEPFSPEESARLVEGELAGALPPHLEALVVETAEGNPFFAEELVSTLVDQGVLERTDRGWRAREVPPGFVVPDSIHALLAARIDLLPPVEKAALQAASVIGRIFWEGPARELIGGAEPDFELLEDRDFVRRRSGSSMAGEREYAIKHALTREVAYASVPKARRARLHAAFARWLEREADVRNELAPLLAHHYAEAVRPEDSDLAWAGAEDELAELRLRAVAALRQAADVAVRRYELHDAIEFLQRAVELGVSPTEEAEIWRDVGRAHAIGYEGQAFWEAMERSLAVCTDRVVCGESYSALAFQTALRSGMWARRPDHALVSEWIDRALELTLPGSAGRARALMARAMWSPQPEEAAAREAAELAEALDDPDLRSWADSAEASVAVVAGRYEDAWRFARRRLELVPLLDDPDHVMEIHETLVPTSIGVGRIDEARALAEAGDAHAERLSPHHRVHGVSLRLEVAELAGDWDEVGRLASRAEELIEANADTPCARNARSLLVCAAGQAVLGDLAEATRLERVATDLTFEGYDLALAGPSLRLALARGELDRLGGTLEAGASHELTFGMATLAVRLEAMVVLGDWQRIEAEAPALLLPGTYLEPFAQRALALARQDEELLQRSQARLEELGLTWHAAQTAALVAA